MAYIKGLTVEIGANTTKFDSAMERIDKNTKGLNSELREINRSLKFDPTNTNLLAQKQKILIERYQETEKRLNTLRQAQDKVTEAYKRGDVTEEQYRKFQSDIAITESKLKGYRKELEQVTNQLLKYSGATGKVAAKMEEFGNKATSAANKMKPMSIAAGLLLTGITKAAIDFESAFAGVIKTVDGTDVELAQLREGIKKMSTEIPASANAIASVAEIAGQLGIEVPNILSFTRTMIDMGESTSLSATDAANAIARMINIMGSSQLDVDRYGSTIVALGNNFATTESEIVDMALRLAGAGKTIGLTEDQVLSMSAALSSLGLSADAGGSAFSQVMRKMQISVETGGQSLEDFASVAGMTAEEFAESFRNEPVVAITEFILGLGRLGDEGISSIKTLDDMGLSQIRISDTLLRSANASDVFTKALSLGEKAWKENTALTDEANKRYETTASKIEILKNKFMLVAINLGEQLLPHIQKLVEWLGGVVDGFANLDPGMQSMIVNVVAATAVASPFLGILGKLSGGLGSLIGNIGGLASKFKAFITGTNLASTAIGSVGSTAVKAAGTGGLGAMFPALGGIVTKLGAVATAAAPWIAAIGAIGVAAYGIYKTLDKEVIPKVDLFADSIKYSSEEVIDAYGNVTYAIKRSTVTISEETKKQMGAYVELSDSVKNTIYRMYVGIEEITEEGIDSLVSKTEQMTNQIIEQNEVRKNKETQILQELFANSKTITAEEQSTMFELLNQGYEDREVRTEVLRDRLIEIYNQIRDSGVDATKEQKDEIDRILLELNENAADVLTQSAVEREVILQRHNAYTERLTAESASNIIKELEDQKQNTIDLASQTRDEQLRIAEEIRAQGGASAEQTADKIISEANRQYNATVDAASKIKSEGIDKIVEANHDLANNVDLETGRIKTYWDKTVESWNNMRLETKVAKIITQIEGGAAGLVQSGIPKYNTGIEEVPYNNMLAFLHKGERVLTAYENKQLKDNGYFGQIPNVLNERSASLSNIPNSSTIIDALNNAFDNITLQHIFSVDGEVVTSKMTPLIDKKMGILSERKRRQ